MNNRCVATISVLLLTGLSAVGQEKQSTATAPTKSDGWELGELCSFYVDFEGTTDARFADGGLSPESIQLTVDGKDLPGKLDNYFAPGLRGKALSTMNEKTTIWVNYPAHNNINTRQGTMIGWLSYTAIVDATTGNLIVNCPGFMYLNSARIVTNQIVTETSTIYFATPPGLSSAHNGYIVATRSKPWNVGEWHQVALTWNLQGIQYFEDGQLLAKQAWETGQPSPENMNKAIYLVLAGWAGTNHNTVAMDEFCIFSAALTDDMIQAEYERMKPAAIVK